MIVNKTMSFHVNKYYHAKFCNKDQPARQTNGTTTAIASDASFEHLIPVEQPQRPFLTRAPTPAVRLESQINTHVLK